jgi:hypothetical protein
MSGMPPLNVDPPLVRMHGSAMETAAGDIPAPPAPFTVTGSDELSAAIGREVPKAEGPIQDGLAPMKRDAQQTAANIKAAADRYAQTDQSLSQEYDKHRFDTAGGPSAGGGGIGSQVGQFGQMVSMPMQMAGQLAQLPTQMVGTAASVPQGIMQGVQSATQGLGQIAGETPGAEKAGAEADADSDEPRSEDAAPASSPPGLPPTPAAQPRPADAGEIRL